MVSRLAGCGSPRVRWSIGSPTRARGRLALDASDVFTRSSNQSRRTAWCRALALGNRRCRGPPLGSLGRSRAPRPEGPAEGVAEASPGPRPDTRPGAEPRGAAGRGTAAQAFRALPRAELTTKKDHTKVRRAAVLEDQGTTYASTRAAAARAARHLKRPGPSRRASPTASPGRAVTHSRCSGGPRGLWCS